MFHAGWAADSDDTVKPITHCKPYHMEAGRKQNTRLECFAKTIGPNVLPPTGPLVARVQTVISIMCYWFAQKTLICWNESTEVYVTVPPPSYTVVCLDCGLWTGVELQEGDVRRFSVTVTGSSCAQSVLHAHPCHFSLGFLV